MFSYKYLQHLRKIFFREWKVAFDKNLTSGGYVSCEAVLVSMRKVSHEIRNIGWSAFRDLDFDGMEEAFNIADYCEYNLHVCSQQLSDALLDRLDAAREQLDAARKELDAARQI